MKIKFELIHWVIEKYKLKRLVSNLCELMGDSAQNRADHDVADKVVKVIILKAYYFRGRKKGARQVKEASNSIWHQV